MMIRVLYLTILVFLVYKGEGKLARTEVKGSILGYKMTLFLGDPKVESKNMSLDTGSPITIVPCRDCVNCQGSSLSQTFYDPETSFTSHKPKCPSNLPVCKNKCTSNTQFCEFKIGYMEGTQEYGTLIEQKIYFNEDSHNPFRAFIGCIFIQNEVHKDEGISSLLGLSPNPSENILYHSFEKYPEDNYQFSTCFDGDAGFFEVGVNPEDDDLEPDMYSRYDGTSKQYQLTGVDEFSFGKININEQIQYVIPDTGSSFLVVPTKIFRNIADLLKTQCSRLRICQVTILQSRQIAIEFKNQIKMPSKRQSRGEGPAHPRLPLNQLPSFTLAMGGKKFQFYPQEYLYQRRSNGQYFLVGVTHKPISFAILGAIWMQGKKLTFNIKEKTFKVYYNYNCTYTPVPEQIPPSAMDKIYYIIDKIMQIQTQYLVIGGLSVVIIAIVFKYFRKQFCQLCLKLKQILARQIQRLKPKPKPKKKKRKKVKRVELSEEIKQSDHEIIKEEKELKRKKSGSRRKGKKERIPDED